MSTLHGALSAKRVQPLCCGKESILSRKSSIANRDERRAHERAVRMQMGGGGGMGTPSRERGGRGAAADDGSRVVMQINQVGCFLIDSISWVINAARRVGASHALDSFITLNSLLSICNVSPACPVDGVH
jgi:hypothetical protein